MTTLGSQGYLLIKKMLFSKHTIYLFLKILLGIIPLFAVQRNAFLYFPAVFPPFHLYLPLFLFLDKALQTFKNWPLSLLNFSVFSTKLSEFFGLQSSNTSSSSSRSNSDPTSLQSFSWLYSHFSRRATDESTKMCLPGFQKV